MTEIFIILTTKDQFLNIWRTTNQFSCLVVSDSLQPHGLRHTRPPCPSPTPGVYSNSCPLSQWCHSTISSSVIPFSRPQSLRISKKYQITCNKNVCLYKQYLRKEKEVALLNRWKSSILLIIRNTKSKYAKILFFSYQNNRVPNVWIYWVGNGVVKKPLLVVREYIYVTSVEGSLVISVKFTNSHTLWPSTSMSTYTWIKWHVQCYL